MNASYAEIDPKKKRVFTTDDKNSKDVDAHQLTNTLWFLISFKTLSFHQLLMRLLLINNYYMLTKRKVCTSEMEAMICMY